MPLLKLEKWHPDASVMKKFVVKEDLLSGRSDLFNRLGPYCPIRALPFYEV